MSELQLASGFPAMDETGWRALVEASLKGRPFETLRSRTADGIVIEPVYGRAHDAPALPAGPAREVAGNWTLTQRADMPDLAAANAQMLDDLANGATGLALVIARQRHGRRRTALPLPMQSPSSGCSTRWNSTSSRCGSMAGAMAATSLCWCWTYTSAACSTCRAAASSSASTRSVHWR